MQFARLDRNGIVFFTTVVQQPLTSTPMTIIHVLASLLRSPYPQITARQFFDSEAFLDLCSAFLTGQPAAVPTLPVAVLILNSTRKAPCDDDRTFFSGGGSFSIIVM